MANIEWELACTIPGLVVTREQKADGWPNELTLENIAKLQYPQDESKERVLLKSLHQDCMSGDLKNIKRVEHLRPPISSMSKLELMQMTLEDNSYEIEIRYVNVRDVARWVAGKRFTQSEHLTAWLTAMEETAEQRQARRHQDCIDAGLKMPTNDYAHMPRGIGKLADKEGISRQSYAEDLKAHRNRR